MSWFKKPLDGDALMMNANSSGRSAAPEPSVTRPEPREPRSNRVRLQPRAAEPRVPNRAHPRRGLPKAAARASGVGADASISRGIVGAGRPDHSGQRGRLDHAHAEPHRGNRRHHEGRHSRAGHRHRRQSRGRSVCHRVGEYSRHRESQRQCVCAAGGDQRGRVLSRTNRDAALGRRGAGTQRASAPGRPDAAYGRRCGRSYVGGQPRTGLASTQVSGAGTIRDRPRRD